MGDKFKERVKNFMDDVDDVMSSFTRVGDMAYELAKNTLVKAEAARKEAWELHDAMTRTDHFDPASKQAADAKAELMKARETNRRLHRRLQLLEGWTKTRMGYPLEQKIEEAAQEEKPTRLRPAKPRAMAKVVTTETVPAEEALK